jgi:putative transposase
MPLRRLPGHDYSSPGAYFVTVCTHRRALLFAEAPAIEAVQACWIEIPSHFAVELDAFVVMPNHVHGIVLIQRAGHARPLPTVIGSFKSAVARSINLFRGTRGEPVWQRGYYDRVIRDERELEALRQYVVSNPASWNADPENPTRTTTPASALWL